MFAQVTAPTASLPAPWGQQDIGTVTLAGNASFANGTFTVSGEGSDIWGTADAFHYVYQPLNTDGQIIARVTGEQNTNAFAKAGVMLRQNLTAGSDEVILDVKPDGSVEFMVRSAQDGSTTFIAGNSPPFSGWLKLVRAGGTASGFVSVDGNTWTMVGSTSISMTTSYVGLAVTSHEDSVLNSATFDNVTVSAGGNCGALPAGWTTQDVGSVGLAGSTCYSSGVFTVTGAGSDIWGTEDSFQYGARPLSGDGQIVARVTDEGNTNAFAKAGVMLRQDRSAGSADVILDVKPDGGIEFMTRSSAGSSTIFVAGSSLSFPVWLKLVRTGATVTGSISPDGSAWTVVGQASVSMTDSTVVGLAVTSHDPNVLNKAMFDNVQ
jgi:regulation of enolase protein 1 (concanavalin A-like superfamily)